MFTPKRIRITSELPPTTLKEIVARVARAGDYVDLPASLSSEGVFVLRFIAKAGNTFRIVPRGLRGISRLQTVEGRGRIVGMESGPDGSRIEVEIGADDGTIINSIVLVVLFVYCAVTLVGDDGPATSTILWVTELGIIVSLVIGILQIRSLAERAWTGMLVVVGRLAAGTLEGARRDAEPLG